MTNEEREKYLEEYRNIDCCENCEYFIHHYIYFQGEFREISCGHCKNCNRKGFQPRKEPCANFQKLSKQEIENKQNKQNEMNIIHMSRNFARLLKYADLDFK